MVCSLSVPGHGRHLCLLFLSMALMTALLGGCEQRAEVKVPAHLIGTWKTDDPRYQGLFLEITDHSVTFNTAEGGLETYWISKTESSDKGNTAGHVIYGEQPRENLRFQLYYESTSGGRLRFKNQIQIYWSKVAHGAQ